MNLLQKIHERWNTRAALRDLIPASRLFTGRVPRSRKDTDNTATPLSITVPFCRVFDGGNDSSGRSNAADEDSYDLTFQFWTHSKREGQTILKQIKALYRNWNATLDDSTLTELSFQSASSIEETKSGEKPIYQYVVNFTAYVGTARTL